jgi:putative salt-induced outer membrane protein YdiY
VLFVVSPGSADELRLRNGDRVSGTVLSLSEGTLRFETPHGHLTVDWEDVTGLTVDEAIVIQAATGEITTLNGGTIDVATVAALSRPEPPVVWNGGANLGFLATSGNTDVNSLRADAELVARARANRYTANALVNRAEDTGRETARNWTASGRYDRFLTKQLYINGSAIFTNDTFRDLDLRTALGAGVGYQMLDTTRARLSAEGGLGRVNEDFVLAPDDSYSALREAVRLDVFLLPDRIAFFHQHDGYFGITGDDNLFFKMQNGVRLSVVAGFVMTAQVDLDYERSPSPGRRHSDRNFALTFGYRF